MFCHNCNAQVSDDAVSCPGCGADLAKEDSDHADEVSVVSEDSVHKSTVTRLAKGLSKRSWAIIGAGMLFLLIVVILMVFIFSQKGYDNYEDLISDYFQAFEQGKERKIIELFANDMQQYAVSLGLDEDDFLSIFDTWNAYYGTSVVSWGVVSTESYDINELGQMNVLATDAEDFIDVEVSVTLSVDEEYNHLTFDFDILKIDGHWYLMEVW